MHKISTTAHTRCSPDNRIAIISSARYVEALHTQRIFSTRLQASQDVVTQMTAHDCLTLIVAWETVELIIDIETFHWH